MRTLNLAYLKSFMAFRAGGSGTSFILSSVLEAGGIEETVPLRVAWFCESRPVVRSAPGPADAFLGPLPHPEAAAAMTERLPTSNRKGHGGQ